MNGLSIEGYLQLIKLCFCSTQEHCTFLGKAAFVTLLLFAVTCFAGNNTCDNLDVSGNFYLSFVRHNNSI